MIKKIYCGIFFIVFFSIFALSSHAQGLQGRWGLGFGLGVQQEYSDVPKTPFGFGGDGLLTYRFTDRLSFSLNAGYNQLGFQVPASTKTFTTKLFFGDLLVDYELVKSGKIRPFVMGGLGVFNFQVQNSKRFNDGEFLAGGGFRVFLNPTSALTFAANAKYTTGDDIDGGVRKVNSINDAYFSMRTGLTFYLGPKTALQNDDLFTQDNSAFEKVNTTDNSTASKQKSDAGASSDKEYNDFLSRLSTLENSGSQSAPGTTSGSSANMDEYLRLKSKLDELNSTIDAKEAEISNLNQTIQTRDGAIASIERTLPVANRPGGSSAPVVVTNFSSSYEAALNKFYSRRYDEAIGLFKALLQKFPNHSLASNCQYWIGECNYANGNYAEAISALDEVLNYPRSLKKDDALMMMGKAYVELGNNNKAQETFNRLIAEYPDSEFVAKSRQMLRKL